MPANRGGVFGYWRDPVFLVSLVLYIINRGLIKPHLHHYSPFFHGHLDDALTAPVALPLYLFVYRWIGLRPDDAAPRWWEVLLHISVWCVFFEWFGPNYLHRGVGDPIDAVSIATGGIVAWFLWTLIALRQQRRRSP
jgi:hypothetical protein